MASPKSVSFYEPDHREPTTWKVCPKSLKRPVGESFTMEKPDAKRNNLNNKILDITLPNGVKAQYIWVSGYWSTETAAMTEAKLRESIIKRKATSAHRTDFRYEFKFVLNPRDRVFTRRVPVVVVERLSNWGRDQGLQHVWTYTMEEWIEKCLARERERARLHCVTHYTYTEPSSRTHACLRTSAC